MPSVSWSRRVRRESVGREQITVVPHVMTRCARNRRCHTERVVGHRRCTAIGPPTARYRAARSWVEAGDSRRDTDRQAQRPDGSFRVGVVEVAKYLVLFSLTGEATKRFVAKPSDRAAVVGELAKSAGGSLESYYWMFGQYDGAAIFVLPDSRTAAALSLAVTSSGAFTHFETHELIEASDLTAIAERAKEITYQSPGA